MNPPKKNKNFWRSKVGFPATQLTSYVAHTFQKSQCQILPKNKTFGVGFPATQLTPTKSSSFFYKKQHTPPNPTSKLQRKQHVHNILLRILFMGFESLFSIALRLKRNVMHKTNIYNNNNKKKENRAFSTFPNPKNPKSSTKKSTKTKIELLFHRLTTPN